MTLMRLAPRKPKISTGPKCLHGTEKDSTLTLHWVLNREIWFFLSIFSYVFIRPYPPFCGHTLLPKINFLTNLNLHSMTSLYISNYLTVEGKHIKKKVNKCSLLSYYLPFKKDAALDLNKLEISWPRAPLKQIYFARYIARI